MTVRIQWDADAPLTGQPDAGTATKVYTTAGAGTVTITDEAIGGDAVTLNYLVPLDITTVETDPVQVDSAGDATARTTTVAGEGFPPSTQGTVAIATGAPGAYGTTVVSTNATTNAEGIFTGAALVVPSDTAAGDYHIEAMFGPIGDLSEALTIVNTELAAPTGLASPSQTATTVNLTWSAVTDAEQYVVRRSPAGAGTWTELAPVATTNTTVTGLAASTSYDFQVKATAAGSTDSAWSTTLTQATTAMPTLATPANAAAGTPTANAIPFSWDAVPNAETYTVSWRPTGGSFTDIPDIVTTNTTVTGLTPDTDYELRVKAVADGYTDSAWSVIVTAHTATLGTLAAPTGINSPSQTATTISLAWTAVPNATSYGIERSPAGLNTWVEVQTAVTNSATISGMTASTNYDFRIAARADGWTASAWSSTFTENTTA